MPFPFGPGPDKAGPTRPKSPPASVCDPKRIKHRLVKDQRETKYANDIVREVLQTVISKVICMEIVKLLQEKVFANAAIVIAVLTPAGCPVPRVLEI